MDSLRQKIEANNFSSADIREIIRLLDCGEIRVAEKKTGEWVVNAWVKTAILQYFPLCEMQEQKLGDFTFRDILPLKQDFQNVRIVPGGSAVRFGSFLADGVVMMPPAYVNIGAYVDEGAMIDSHALVGSCAQIGKKVHLSAGVQIGGVLEPAQAAPTIIEDNAFLGAGVIAVEGVIVEEGAVIAPGTVLSASVRILETDAEGKITAEHRGRVPKDAIVVPGARARGEVSVQTPVIIGYRTGMTAEKVGINELLRQF